MPFPSHGLVYDYNLDDAGASSRPDKDDEDEDHKKNTTVRCLFVCLFVLYKLLLSLLLLLLCRFVCCLLSLLFAGFLGIVFV